MFLLTLATICISSPVLFQPIKALAYHHGLAAACLQMAVMILWYLLACARLLQVSGPNSRTSRLFHSSLATSVLIHKQPTDTARSS